MKRGSERGKARAGGGGGGGGGGGSGEEREREVERGGDINKIINECTKVQNPR